MHSQDSKNSRNGSKPFVGKPMMRKGTALSVLLVVLSLLLSPLIFLPFGKWVRLMLGALSICTFLGAALVYDNQKRNPVKALYTTAIINGLLAPVLLVGILIVASDKKAMCGQPCSLRLRSVGILTTILMFGAAVAMFAL